MRRAFVLGAILAPLTCSATDLGSLQQSVESALKGKDLLLKNFYENSELKYRVDGKVEKGKRTDCWTRAEIEIDKVNLEKNLLELEAHRVVSPGEKVRISAELPNGETDADMLGGVLGRIFYKTSDKLPSLKPLQFEAPGILGYKPERMDSSTISRPTVISSPDPDYTEEARREHKEGTVLLWAVLGEDGSMREVKACRCIGNGLDEKAIEAVSKWRFQPALKDGRPVAVWLNIQVSFHLY